MGIAPDTDKSYSSGRLPVSPKTTAAVEELVRRQREVAGKLVEILQRELEASRVDIDSKSLNISISFPSGHNAMARNDGLDTMNGWPMFSVGPDHRPLAVFVFSPVPRHLQNLHGVGSAWFLWRGKFAKRGVVQNDWNAPTKDLLQQALSRS